MNRTLQGYLMPVALVTGANRGLGLEMVHQHSPRLHRPPRIAPPRGWLTLIMNNCTFTSWTFEMGPLSLK